MKFHPADIVHQSDGAWWFWEETWCHRNGPYETEEQARQALDDYCITFLEGQKEGQ